MRKALSLKIDSDHLLLCAFLLWALTDSSTASTPSTEINSTEQTSFTTPLTTPSVTPPAPVENLTAIQQNETSITLQWNKVADIRDYILAYNTKEINVTASDSPLVTQTIINLINRTRYQFTVFTVHGGIRSSGVNLTAFTAPQNAENFGSTAQNESSITLQWEKVAGILNYRVSFNGSHINVTASEGQSNVKHTISGLMSGTKYDFSLFALFENIKSSGVNHTAATAPQNTENFGSIGQNESSITLQWEKVAGIPNYRVSFNGSHINVTASEGQSNVTHTISGLMSGTKYDFSLFALFENIKSSGVNHTAATAPQNTENFGSIGQNESSITLQWEKVAGIPNYRVSFNGSHINVTASEGQSNVTHTISGLMSGTKYDFSLFALFENIKSSGINHTAATAPQNTENFGSIGQNESSITLQWEKVTGIPNYRVSFNGSHINVTASEGQSNVTHTISGLTSGTKYDFGLFALFENIKSSGVNHTAATVGQNESSITLQWERVDRVLNYRVLFRGKEINLTVSAEQGVVTHPISGLTSGTKYDFSLFAVFENVSSSGVNHTAATVPSMVASVNVTQRSVTTITLAWNVDTEKEWSYFLQMNGENLHVFPQKSKGVVSKSFSSLMPGTEYPFNLTTMFSGLNSTVYKDFIVTAIDCASVGWHVTSSSIQGMVEGLFTNATATNKSQTITNSLNGSNVSFTGLYPGATYEVSLVYERYTKRFEQCSHNLTVIPSDLSAQCEYWAAGYSVFIVWNKPEGVWTSVEVNVTGQTYIVKKNGMEHHIKISGFQPAKTYDVSIALLSGTVRSNKPFVFSCPTDPRGVIAGSVVGVLLFAALVCLALFILLKRPNIISRKKPFIGGSKLSHKKAIALARFPDHFYQLSVDDNRGFSQEYESLLPVGSEQSRKNALLPENKARNRFNNVLPYDWSRVRLSTSNPKQTSDYINANYMPGYNSNREYIATQGPLPSTVSDFWSMIWEQKVRGIVMVTNCTEGGKTKCEQYWPADSQPCPCGELIVTMRSEQQEPNWTLREFRLKHTNTSEMRTVKHFHFTAWPDHGVPQGTEVLIQFRGLVRHHIETEGTGAPTVVHCSAGVGRTGTLIALDVLLQQLEKERAVGINSFVHKMRLSRPHMVQTESQYVFLHQCIMNCLQANEKTNDNIYENADMIYENATALREFHNNA